ACRRWDQSCSWKFLMNAPISAFAKSVVLFPDSPPGRSGGRQAGPDERASRRLYTNQATPGVAWPFPGRGRRTALPAGLAQARHVTAHGGLAQHVPAQPELRVDRARAAGQGAAGGLPGRRGVARQLLEPGRGLELFLVARRLAGDDLLQLLALGGVLLHQLGALGLAVDHGGLRHVCFLSCGTGSGRPRARPWLRRWSWRWW